MLNDFKINEFYQFVITILVVIVNVILLAAGKSNNSFEILMTSAVTFWFVHTLNARRLENQDENIKRIKTKIDTQEAKAVKVDKDKNSV